jgi:hypothetical protein
MSNSMKRFLVLGSVLVLFSSAVAKADTLAGTFTNGAETITINYNTSALTGGLAGVDQINFTIGSITGAGSAKVNAILAEPSEGNSLGGNAQFTALGSGNVAIFADYADQADAKGGAAPASFVNFDATNGMLVGSVAAGVTPPSGYSVGAYTTFADSWYTSKPGNQLAAGGILAEIFVTHGAGVSCVGELGLTNGDNFLGSFSTAPEPSTIVLLASGLIGLAAYAWRKRK